MSNQLYCGAAKRKITPPKELWENLRGLMGMKYVAVEDELYVRAAVLRSGNDMALFVGYDLDKAPYPQETMEKINQKHGIPVENITIYGIHTHSAPATGLRPGEHFNDPRRHGEAVAKATEEYENIVLAACHEAVDEAMGKLQPAKISFAKEACAVNINRNLHNAAVDANGNISEYVGGHSVLGPVDHNVYVTKLASDDGSPIAIIVNYAVHCTTMFQNDYDGKGGSALSGDLGGNVSQMLENHFPGAVALWCSGAAGDVGCMMFETHRRPGEEAETQHNPAYAQKLGSLKQVCNLNYAAVISALNKMDAGTAEAEIRGAVEFVQVPTRKIIRGERGSFTIDNEAESEPGNIRLHMLRIGKLAFCGIGGELYTTHAQAIQECAALKNVVIINHDASMIDDANYIPDDETIICSDRSGGRGRAWKYRPGYIKDALSSTASQMLEKLL